MRHSCLSLALLLLGCGLPALAQPAETSASLELTSIPPHALIFLDRELKGKGHVILNVSSGPHLLRVAAGLDYEPYIRTLELTSQTPTRLKIQLAPSARRWLERGRALLEKGDWDQAYGLLQRCQERLPVEASWWQAIAAWKAGHNEEAVAQFRGYAHYVTDSPELFLFLGLLHSQLGHPGEAFTSYKTALLLPSALGPQVLSNLPAPTFEAIKAMGKPEKPADKVRLAQLQMLKGMNDQALQTIQGAVKDQFGPWTQRDWLHWEPKLPPTKSEAVAPAEDAP